MSTVELDNTKQSRQITQLRHSLEKVGWRIEHEESREFIGKPRWDLNDEIPNLICSWTIIRNPKHTPVWIDFIAWFDEVTYETYISDCSFCEIRGTDIQLYFYKDKNLKYAKHRGKWESELARFLIRLNQL